MTLINKRTCFYSEQYWYDLHDFKIYRGENTIYVSTPLEKVRRNRSHLYCIRGHIRLAKNIIERSIAS